MVLLRSKQTLSFDTLLLVSVAAIALTLFRVSLAWVPAQMLARAVCELMFTFGLAFYLWRRAQSSSQAWGFMTVAIGVAAAYPFIAEAIMRYSVGGSQPLEMCLLIGLQLTTIVLAVFGDLRRTRGTAVLLSSFLFLLVTTMSDTHMILALAGIYGALVLWWLMGAYWDRMSGALLPANVERRIPVRVSVIVSTLVVAALVALLASGGGNEAIALQGFMPTSGGNKWYDPYARSGVGDGDAIVSAKDEALSFGPVDSELFLESDMPSLYDMFNDLYGDPPKSKKRKQDRSIALAPGDAQESEQKIATTERSGREFSTVRKKVGNRRKSLDDRRAAAMLYVVGRVPVHLALERFDTFDGRRWTHSDANLPTSDVCLETEQGKHWGYFKSVGESPLHRGSESRALKVINLKTDRYPAPPHLTAVHVNKVDQLDFFGWTKDGCASMPVREFIPQLTVVHVRTQGIDEHTLCERKFHPPFLETEQGPDLTELELATIQRHLVVTGNEERLTRVAAGWVRGIPRGWPQVEAVITRLRHDFSLDPASPAPEDCDDVVAHFLEVERGPGYLFATTAAAILRKLGYPTRLVTGFYASEERYDRQAGQTTVLAEDVHVWVEVRVDQQTWIPVEPTPGYRPPRASRQWRQFFAEMWTACLAWVRENFVLSTLGCVAAVVVWLTRVVFLDALFTAVFRLAGQIDSRQRALWTMRLLEWRTWLAGHPRPDSATLAQWHGGVANVLPKATASSLRTSLHAAELLLYGNELDSAGSPTTDAELRAACAVVEQRIGASCFRDAFGEVNTGPKVARVLAWRRAGS